MQGGMFGVNVRLPASGQRKPRVLQRAAFSEQTVDSAVLAQMGRTLALEKMPLVTLLGRHDYQLFMLDKPAVRPDEMESSLRLAVSPLIVTSSTVLHLQHRPNSIRTPHAQSAAYTLHSPFSHRA